MVSGNSLIFTMNLSVTFCITSVSSGVETKLIAHPLVPKRPALQLCEGRYRMIQPYHN